MRRHREPPFGEDPAGTLPCGGSPGQDDFGVIGAGAGTQIREDLRQLALDAGVVVHPTVPPDASEAAGAARPTSARMSPRARLSRDLAVPIRDAETGRDLAQRQPQEVVQHDDRPTLLVETAHDAIDQRPIGDRIGRIVHGLVR